MKQLLIILSLVLVACANKEDAPSAQTIVDSAISVACNGNCENASMDFTFRNRCYVSTRNGGAYQFERIFEDSTGVTRDILTNNGFERYKNDVLVTLADSIASKYANSVNSVLYFAQLPFGLNAPAVKKELLGEALIKGKNYYEVGIRFAEEGGGTDFEDEFVYWISTETYTVDYLAYSYATNGGGIRFREAYNPRSVEGIRFVDYNNYKPKTLEVPLTELDSLFEKGELNLLSKIETEAVAVVL